MTCGGWQDYTSKSSNNLISLPIGRSSVILRSMSGDNQSPNVVHRSVFPGTKGRVLALLRGGGLTVAELSNALEMTGNAVRGHLAALERDRMVESRGSIRGVGKPSRVYGLTPEAQALFPKAYGLVMGAILDELRKEQTPAELAAFLRAAGQRLAGDRTVRGRSVNARLHAAAEALSSLGTVARVEKTAAGFAIACHDCPLADVASSHAEACAIANAILSEIVETQLETRCTRGARPACRFELHARDEGRAASS